MKGAKEASTRPYDWAFGLGLFVDYLYFMRDWFVNGKDVHQVDESANEIITQLNEVLAAYESWMNCEEEFMKWIPDNDKTMGGHFEYLQGTREATVKKLSEEYPRRREHFFELLGKNIEKWWD